LAGLCKHLAHLLELHVVGSGTAATTKVGARLNTERVNGRRVGEGVDVLFRDRRWLSTVGKSFAEQTTRSAKASTHNSEAVGRERRKADIGNPGLLAIT